MHRSTTICLILIPPETYIWECVIILLFRSKSLSWLKDYSHWNQLIENYVFASTEMLETVFLFVYICSIRKPLISGVVLFIFSVFTNNNIVLHNQTDRWSTERKKKSTTLLKLSFEKAILRLKIFSQIHYGSGQLHKTTKRQLEQHRWVCPMQKWPRFDVKCEKKIIHTPNILK